MTNEEKFKWPSERVCKGGFFHPPKVKYSKDTEDLLKLLMEEAKLSMMLQKKINYHLRNGDSLPTQSIYEKRSEQRMINDENSDIKKRSLLARRRSFDTIKASGAYEKSRYRPPPSLKIPNDLAKVQLQEKMSGMKMYPDLNKKYQRKTNNETELNLDINDQIDELLAEIFERVDWLKEMEELGEGKKYRDMIQSQIQERLRQIKNLEKRK